MDRRTKEEAGAVSGPSRKACVPLQTLAIMAAIDPLFIYNGMCF